MNEKEDLKEWNGVVLAPPSPFVFQCQEPVDGMLASEAEEAARLAFEEESPFPSEQVGTGLLSDASGKIGIYGCERSKLPETEDSQFLVPAFFPFLGWDRGAGSVEVVVAGNGCSVLAFEQGGSIPSEVVGFEMAEEEIPWDEIGETVRYLGIAWPGREGVPVLRLKEAVADSRGRFTARVETEDGAERTWAAGPDVLWKADLRPREELQRLRAERATGERIWKGSLITVAFLGLLLLAQGVLWGLDLWVESREDRVVAQSEAVTRVEERAILAQRLAGLGQSRLSVFEKLGELNLLRPEGVQFVKVEFSEPDRFLVEGRAPRIRIYNSYVERLQGDPRFTIGEMNTPRSRDGRIDFELDVRVGEGGGTSVDASVAVDPGEGDGSV